MHMGKQLVSILKERNIQPVDFRPMVSKHLTFVPKGELVSKQWVYEVCQTECWRPRNLTAIAKALKVDPSIFFAVPQVSPKKKKRKAVQGTA